MYGVSRSNTTGAVVSRSDVADAQLWNLSELQQSDERVEPEYESVFEQAVDVISHP